MMNNFSVIRKSFSLFPKQWNHNFSLQNFTNLTEHYQMFHTSAASSNYYILHKKKLKKLPKNNDDEKVETWLPFEWKLRRRKSFLLDSGDTIKENICEMTLPKPDFEYSDELKNASPEVKHFFSLATGTQAEKNEVCKRQLIKKFQRHPNDFDSPEVKIARLTANVRTLYVHHQLYSRKERIVSGTIFPRILEKRNQLLKQMRNIDEERFQWLLKELQLTFEPKPLDTKPEKYSRASALRSLTKEYCEDLIDKKKTEYHEELKAQQAAFLEEKAEILAWIEAEEKAIAELGV